MKKKRPTRPPDKTDPEATAAQKQASKKHSTTNSPKDSPTPPAHSRPSTTKNDNDSSAKQHSRTKTPSSSPNKAAHQQNHASPNNSRPSAHSSSNTPTNKKKETKKDRQRKRAGLCRGRFCEGEYKIHLNGVVTVHRVSSNTYLLTVRVLHVAHTARPAHGMDHSARPQPPPAEDGRTRRGCLDRSPSIRFSKSLTRIAASRPTPSQGTPRCSASSRTRKTQQGPHSRR